MDQVRHWMAVLLAIGYPPGVAYWYVVHPFAGWWRRLGARASLWVLSPLLGAAVLGGFRIRTSLIGRDLGFSWPAALVGLGLYLGSLVIERSCRRQLKFSILAGVPELSRDSPGTLLTQGIYGRVRHPRYLAVLLSTAGWSLVANHVGLYWVTAATSLALIGVVYFEERELSTRFGSAYTEYATRVPRFIPRPTA